MEALCKLFHVPEDFYSGVKGLTDINKRDVDFYLIDPDGKKHKCEVKLMGKGNPESADAIFARDTDIFVADTLSGLNKNQADNENVKWVELRSPNGYHKFYDILQMLNIPSQDFRGDLDTELDGIFQSIFNT